MMCDFCCQTAQPSLIAIPIAAAPLANLGTAHQMVVVGRVQQAHQQRMPVIRSLSIDIMKKMKMKTAACLKRPFVYTFFLFITLGLLLGCTRETPPITPTMVPPPTAVAITVDGETVKLQEGEMWVLVSGVDEHGLMAEHDLFLRHEPRQDAIWSEWVHSGTAVAVREIHYSGPQNLRRFYHIETPTGASGWISDYYVRQQAYLYEPDAETVALFDAPDGETLINIPNVSPVKLLNPVDEVWWEVETLDGKRGWVSVDLVKESAERQFLTETQHEHGEVADEQ